MNKKNEPLVPATRIEEPFPLEDLFRNKCPQINLNLHFNAPRWKWLLINYLIQRVQNGPGRGLPGRPGLRLGFFFFLPWWWMSSLDFKTDTVLLKEQSLQNKTKLILLVDSFVVFFNFSKLIKKQKIKMNTTLWKWPPHMLGLVKNRNDDGWKWHREGHWIIINNYN